MASKLNGLDSWVIGGLLIKCICIGLGEKENVNI